jgi:hypothetical protein
VAHKADLVLAVRNRGKSERSGNRFLSLCRDGDYQPRIDAKITFLEASEGGRVVLPANLASGQYRPHVVIDPNQLRAVTVESVPEEPTWRYVRQWPGTDCSWAVILGGPCVDVLAQH